MPTWQQEMGWYCATCEKLNRGRFKECQNCGKPKAGEPFVDLPEEGEGIEWAVKDPELVKQAKAGPDWQCMYCGSHQRRDDGNCASCGSRQGDSAQQATKWDDGTVGRPADPEAGVENLVNQVIRESAKPPRSKPTKSSPVSSRSSSPPPMLETEHYTPPKPPFWTYQRRVGAGIALVILLLSLGLYFLFRPRIVDASVVASNWEYTVEVERYQVRDGSGFEEDRPGDAFDVLPAGLRHHHYDKVPDGEEAYTAREACGTTPRVCTPIPRTCYRTPVTCTSNGNGFKTCSGGDERCSGGGENCTGGETKYCNVTKYRTKYRDVSRSAMWYTWHVWRWGHHRTITEQGNDTKPHWPSPQRIALEQGLATGEKEREKRSSKYWTIFRDPDGESHRYQPRTIDEFKQLPKGTHRKLKVSVLGNPEILPQ